MHHLKLAGFVLCAVAVVAGLHGAGALQPANLLSVGLGTKPHKTTTHPTTAHPTTAHPTTAHPNTTHPTTTHPNTTQPPNTTAPTWAPSEEQLYPSEGYCGTQSNLLEMDRLYFNISNSTLYFDIMTNTAMVRYECTANYTLGKNDGRDSLTGKRYVVVNPVLHDNCATLVHDFNIASTGIKVVFFPESNTVMYMATYPVTLHSCSYGPWMPGANNP